MDFADVARTANHARVVFLDALERGEVRAVLEGTGALVNKLQRIEVCKRAPALHASVESPAFVGVTWMLVEALPNAPKLAISDFL